MEKPGLPPKQALPPKPSGAARKQGGEESIMNLMSQAPNEEAIKKTPTYDQYKGKSLEELEAILDGYKKGNPPPEDRVAPKENLPPKVEAKKAPVPVTMERRNSR